ncbi:MAG: hypothetical protein QG672_659 [Pseudomonadota bacterium]|nr:hypothetical protein [Pseudomonadota bacterium]
MKFTAILAAALLAATMPALAGDGHDHGEAPASAGGPAAPRFSSASDVFELVGVVEGKRLALYLSRYDDSSPVKNARLEIELGGVKIPVEAHGEGQFEAMLAAAPKAGVIPVAATIYAGDETDLLAGELDVHDESAVAGTAHSTSWRDYATWGVAATLALLLATIGLRRFALLRNTQNARHGGAA